MIASWTEKTASVLDNLYILNCIIRDTRYEHTYSLTVVNILVGCLGWWEIRCLEGRWEGETMPSQESVPGKAQVTGVCRGPINNLKVSRRRRSPRSSLKHLLPIDCFCISNSLQIQQNVIESAQLAYNLQLPWPRPPATREHPELPNAAA